MLTMCLLYILVYTAIGTVIVGWFVMPLDALLLMLLLCAVLTVCLSAVMTAVVMLNQNKAVVAVLSIILALGRSLPVPIPITDCLSPNTTAVIQ